MQFHEYRTLRNQMLVPDDEKYPEVKTYRSKLKRISSADWRKTWIHDLYQPSDQMKEYDWGTSMAALCEDIWVDHERPYYNVWPVAIELARNVTLDLPFSDVGIPFDSMVLRFPKGHEPLDVRVAMLFWPRAVSTLRTAAIT